MEQGVSRDVRDVRVRAVDAVRKGMPVSHTATTFGVDRTTLHRWLARYGEEGEAGLQAAYGAKLTRLAAIKAKYDPSNLLRLNQNIAPAQHAGA